MNAQPISPDEIALDEKTTLDKFKDELQSEEVQQGSKICFGIILALIFIGIGVALMSNQVDESLALEKKAKLANACPLWMNPFTTG